MTSDVLLVAADPQTGFGRRFSPAVMLATVAPIAGGGGANLVKDIAQARGEENEREPVTALSTILLNNWLGRKRTWENIRNYARRFSGGIT